MAHFFYIGTLRLEALITKYFGNFDNIYNFNDFGPNTYLF